jgi:hypothetical protein
MLVIYFARKKFNGHQASYGFALDKDTFERIDRGQVGNNKIIINGNNVMPYVSHSFNQFVLPIDNGFVFADHGDAYPRAFSFAKFQNGKATKKINAFQFPGSKGANPTYAEMGGLAKTQTGYIFAGTYGTIQNNPRNLFILTFDEDLSKCSAPVYLTNYTRDNGHAGHPKIVSIGSGQYLLLWELFSFSTQRANAIGSSRTNYRSTFALVINENGEPASQVREFKGVRLNINDTLRYNPVNGKAYWAINSGSDSIVVYALNVKP